MYIYIEFKNKTLANSHAGQPNNFGLLLIRGFYVNFRMDLHIKPLYTYINMREFGGKKGKVLQNHIRNCEKILQEK